jgi:PIN domain nuclease of toxin-antitoxin system
MRHCRPRCSSFLATIPDVNLLLDTHAFIWWAGVDERLSETARLAIADAENRVIVSAVTVWEISIKRAIGKLKFSHDILLAIE